MDVFGVLIKKIVDARPQLDLGRVTVTCEKYTVENSVVITVNNSEVNIYICNSPKMTVALTLIYTPRSINRLFPLENSG